MLWLLRDQTDSAVQRAVSLGIFFIFAGIAGTGVDAYLDQIANAAILIAAAGEMFIAVTFGWLLWKSNGQRP